MPGDEPPDNTKTVRKSKSDKQVEKTATKWQIDQLWKATKDFKDLLQNPSLKVERLLTINKQISKNNETNNPLRQKRKKNRK